MLHAHLHAQTWYIAFKAVQMQPQRRVHADVQHTSLCIEHETMVPVSTIPAYFITKTEPPRTLKTIAVVTKAAATRSPVVRGASSPTGEAVCSPALTFPTDVPPVEAVTGVATLVTSVYMSAERAFICSPTPTT